LSLLQRIFGRNTSVEPPARIDAELFESLAEKYPFLSGFSAEEAGRLCALAEQFIATKHFEGVGGLELTHPMRAEIALQASVPILELGLDWYKDWREVVVYPAQFVPRREVIDDAGVVHVVEEPLSGEAWLGGPVLLSYEDIEAASDALCYNVVIHEFAHKLDMLNGEPNGTPPLHAGMSYKAWGDAFSAAYADFVAKVEASPDPDNDESFVIDPYAAEHPAEFFAVLSEAFFDVPDVLVETYPEVYEQLRQFYMQHPLSRMETAPTDGS
jgi:MtfA peptidase